MAQLFGLKPWEMGEVTLQEYIGLHYYRQALENPE